MEVIITNAGLIISGIVGTASIIGVIITVLKFIGDRPKREEVRTMIDDRIGTIHVTLTEMKEAQLATNEKIDELVKTVAGICAYQERR